MRQKSVAFPTQGIDKLVMGHRGAVPWLGGRWVRRAHGIPKERCVPQPPPEPAGHAVASRGMAAAGRKAGAR